MHWNGLTSGGAVQLVGAIVIGMYGVGKEEHISGFLLHVTDWIGCGVPFSPV